MKALKALQLCLALSTLLLTSVLSAEPPPSLDPNSPLSLEKRTEIYQAAEKIALEDRGGLGVARAVQDLEKMEQADEEEDLDEEEEEGDSELDLLDEDGEEMLDGIEGAEETGGSERMEVSDDSDVSPTENDLTSLIKSSKPTAGTGQAQASYRLFPNARELIDDALREQVPNQADELLASLDVIRTRSFWPDATEEARMAVEIEAWQDVLVRQVSEDEAGIPEGSNILIGRIERYLLPIVSELAWAPNYAFYQPRQRRNGKVLRECRFGSGATMSERVAAEAREVDSSIIGQLDPSYVTFPGAMTGQHPFQQLSPAQRSAHYRFHSRLFTRLLQYPRLLVINGGDSERDFLIPLMASRQFDAIAVRLDCALGDVTGEINLGFVRPRGSARWSVLLRRRHPQALDPSSAPTRRTRLEHDATSELLRQIGYRGSELGRPKIHLALADATGRDLQEEEIEIMSAHFVHRINYLAAVERGVGQPFDDEALKMLDPGAFIEARRYLAEHEGEPLVSIRDYGLSAELANSLLQRTFARYRSTRSSNADLVRIAKLGGDLTESEREKVEALEAKWALSRLNRRAGAVIRKRLKQEDQRASMTQDDRDQEQKRRKENNQKLWERMSEPVRRAYREMHSKASGWASDGKVVLPDFDSQGPIASTSSLRTGDAPIDSTTLRDQSLDPALPPPTLNLSDFLILGRVAHPVPVSPEVPAHPAPAPSPAVLPSAPRPAPRQIPLAEFHIIGRIPHPSSSSFPLSNLDRSSTPSTSPTDNLDDAEKEDPALEEGGASGEKAIRQKGEQCALPSAKLMKRRDDSNGDDEGGGGGGNGRWKGKGIDGDATYGGLTISKSFS